MHPKPCWASQCSGWNEESPSSPTVRGPITPPPQVLQVRVPSCSTLEDEACGGFQGTWGCQPLSDSPTPLFSFPTSLFPPGLSQSGHRGHESQRAVFALALRMFAAVEAWPVVTAVHVFRELTGFQSRWTLGDHRGLHVWARCPRHTLTCTPPGWSGGC